MSHAKTSSVSFGILVAAVMAAGPPASAQDASGLTTASLSHLRWRHIGPASFGGRIADVEAVPDDPARIFVAAASGGIFRSVNNGVTWDPVFDEEGTLLSIGDLAIAPSDPNIVWAGTGEPNNRQTSSWGDGVYKSVDGGEVWEHMGLRESHHIGRIVIHPRNPDIVYVAALGHLWGPNEERGLYRTQDGGTSWEQVLGINADTGVVDVALDQDGRTLFAAAYQRRRRTWGFVGGGPHSGLHRSLDGGDTWQKLTGGLPAENVGRIGIAVSRSDPHIVYATVQHKDGGVFRSEDRGVTWTRVNHLNQHPAYFSQIRVDPNSPNKVWLLGSSVYVSIDGGTMFRSATSVPDIRVRLGSPLPIPQGAEEKIHVDHHALWINPSNPDHLMVGNDGGLYFSYDGGRQWDFIDSLPIGQYYDIGIDTRDPYWVYGGTQDNGTWAIPSRTYSGLGIMNADVVNIAFGDGFYTIPDPENPRVIYANSQNGRTYLIDLETREEQGIRPVPEDPEEEYRFNWSTPMLLSPHDSDVVYYGGNMLFKTTDRGHGWQVISPDLTGNQEWKKLPIMGVERNDETLARDYGVNAFGTLTTIAESPLEAGVLYVGSDDGYVQVTRDGGQTWENLMDRFGLPGPRWVNRVIASHHAAGTAYVAFDGHQDDDFRPYLFKTMDYGGRWTGVSGDLPAGTVINALAEHPRNADLLFAGTESGLFVTVNGGRHWVLVHGSLPRVPIDDVIINARENDVILGTHGRSIIVLDDIALLEELTAAVLESEAHLFSLRTATQYHEMRQLPIPGASEFSGPNPDYGALITYYLKSEPPMRSTEAGDDGSAGEEPADPTVQIRVLDRAGRTVRELEGPDRGGFNRVAWDLRYPLSFEARDDDGGWFGPPKGPFVVPGEYTVTLQARGRELRQTVAVRVDPRAQTNASALEARFAANQRVSELQRAFAEGVGAIEVMDREIKRLSGMLEERENVPDATTGAMTDVANKLDEMKEKFAAGWAGLRHKISDLAGQLQASTAAPTEAQLRTLDHLTVELTENVTALNALLTQDIRDLDRGLSGSNLSPLIIAPVALPGRQP